MTKAPIAICGLFLASSIPAQRVPSQEPVEMELMTSPEVYSAMHDHGKTTAIVFTGSIEQRGPHAVLGGHTLMARGIAVEIARKLGNALVAPVLPVAPTDQVGPKIPGGISIPSELFVSVNRSEVESLIKDGFKNVIIMVDHGSALDELIEMAKSLDVKYAPQGTRVIVCKDVYDKARGIFDEYAKSTMKQGFAYGTHGGLYDTSLLLYLQPQPGVYVRDNYKTVTPNPRPGPGAHEGGTAGDSGTPPRNAARDSAAAPVKVDNGIDGDPRFATAELGKKMMEIKVQVAIDEINRKLTASAPSQR